jgi:hypothetical protein
MTGPVQVDRALADAGAGGDVLDRHPPVPVAQHQLGRRVENPVARSA